MSSPSLVVFAPSPMLTITAGLAGGQDLQAVMTGVAVTCQRRASRRPLSVFGGV